MLVWVPSSEVHVGLPTCISLHDSPQNPNIYCSEIHLTPLTCTSLQVSPLVHHWIGAA